jgi:hypothetical protein
LEYLPYLALDGFGHLDSGKQLSSKFADLPVELASCNKAQPPAC